MMPTVVSMSRANPEPFASTSPLLIDNHARRSLGLEVPQDVQPCLPSNSCSSVNDAGLGPRNVASIASTIRRWVIAPICWPLLVTVTAFSVKSSEKLSPTSMAGIFERNLSTSSGSRWHGIIQLLLRPSRQAFRASSALTLCSNLNISSLVSGDRMISSGLVLKCSR